MNSKESKIYAHVRVTYVCTYIANPKHFFNNDLIRTHVATKYI